MNTLHGQPVEAGDEVYSITHGYGKVVTLFTNGKLLVEFVGNFNTIQMAVYQDGRLRPEDISSVLFWTKPEIYGGLKKRTKVRKVIFVVKTETGGLMLMDVPYTEERLKHVWPQLEIVCEVPGTEVIEYI